MTPAEVPDELVEILAKRGYEVMRLSDKYPENWPAWEALPEQGPVSAALHEATLNGARGDLVAVLPLYRAMVLDGARTLPDPKSGCACSFDSEDRGGGHSELVQEYDPACPVHSEHLYDPRTGMWVHRDGGEAIQELPVRMFVPERATGGVIPDGAPAISREGTEYLIPLASRPELIESANQRLANFGLQPMTPEEIGSAKVQPPVEHEHRWVDQTTYADGARGVTVQACTRPGCPAVLEEHQR